MRTLKASGFLTAAIAPPLIVVACATTTPAPRQQPPARGTVTEPKTAAPPPRKNGQPRKVDAPTGPRTAAPADNAAYLPPSCKNRGGSLTGVMAITWPTTHGHLRRFRLTRDLSKVKSTKATPVELCGVREQLAWLMRARCPDGSAPYSQPMVAHRSRVGNVGPGGRCGSIIDLYRVRCPKQTFNVYISAYHCLSGESPFGR